MMMTLVTGLIGIVADLIAVNRELLEKLLTSERSRGQPPHSSAQVSAQLRKPTKKSERSGR